MPSRTGTPYAEDTLAASAARTVTGNSGEFDSFGEASTLRAQLDITAASGTTPTLDVLIQDTLDGTNWNTVGTFAQKVTTGREVINITVPFARRVRALWTITGTTPSFTFSVVVASQAASWA